MKTAGIIGGIGPESTVDYYRSIIALYRERTGSGGYPSIVINSIDLAKMLGLIGGGKLAEVTAYLAAEIRRLAAAGADFGLLAANTPHVVFDALAAGSPIPLISIVGAACRAARAHGHKRLGLLGTRFTMQGRFYAQPFLAAGIELIAPHPEEQDLIHERYMNELVPGVFRPQTREAFSAIIARMKRQDKVDGIVLAGTELPLLMRDATAPGIALLDTTRLHVEQAVDCLLSA
ncbi:MAG TPA: amino acid racemase [Burkholderiales bacterium]|nr:amino acid racemase [Burkholderiales bacterium]